MRTLVFLVMLFVSTSATAQIKFAVELQEDKKTYLVKLKPEASYASPLNITNTAQVSFVVPTGGFQAGNIQNIKGNWQNNNNVVAPEKNPTKDYLIFNLVGHIKDVDYVEGEEVALFTFQNVGKKTGKPRFVQNKDIEMLQAKKLNIGNQISVLGAGYTNAYSGTYVTDAQEEEEEYEEGPESEDTQVLYGTFIEETFDLDITVEKEGIALEWLAEQKAKTANFTLEKSMDGFDFTPIQTVEAELEEAVRAIDDTPDYGTNYYRVKQTFSDGSYRYSDIQQEQFLVDEASITVYPNPVRDVFNLKLGHFSKLEGTVRIFSMSGIEMATQQLDASRKTVRINTTDFQNGMYFLIIESPNSKMVERQFIVENMK
ncbi:MAG: T9SS type A sorting domain-containing protein [Bacteroidota bacterium]